MINVYSTFPEVNIVNLCQSLCRNKAIYLLPNRRHTLFPGKVAFCSIVFGTRLLYTGFLLSPWTEEGVYLCVELSRIIHKNQRSNNGK